MLKMAFLIIITSASFYTSTTLAQAKKDCNYYNMKFMVSLHATLELSCASQDLKKHKKCKALLKALKKHNKSRSKHCYQ
jgi:hypothetical protein